jgi:hypothetical protein
MLEKVSARGAVKAAQRHPVAQQFASLSSSSTFSLRFQVSATSETRLRPARLSTRHSHCRVAHPTRHSETSRNGDKLFRCIKTGRATRHLFRTLKNAQTIEIFTTSPVTYSTVARRREFPSSSIGRVQIGYISSPVPSNRESLRRTALITYLFSAGYVASLVADYMHLRAVTKALPWSGGTCVQVGDASKTS